MRIVVLTHTHTLPIVTQRIKTIYDFFVKTKNSGFSRGTSIIAVTG